MTTICSEPLGCDGILQHQLRSLVCGAGAEKRSLPRSPRALLNGVPVNEEHGDKVKRDSFPNGDGITECGIGGGPCISERSKRGTTVGLSCADALHSTHGSRDNAARDNGSRGVWAGRILAEATRCYLGYAKNKTRRGRTLHHAEPT